MDNFPPLNVDGTVDGPAAIIFSATFDLDAALEQAERNYNDRDCPMMWKFAEVHTLYICGPYAKDAFRRYMEQIAPHNIVSPRLLRLYEHGLMEYCGVPVTFTSGGEGYMFVEHPPRRYKG